VLAILDGPHALYKVGQRLEERGMVTLLQEGLARASLHAYRLGHILDAHHREHVIRHHVRRLESLGLHIDIRELPLTA
jgi:hypothetical protein